MVLDLSLLLTSSVLGLIFLFRHVARDGPVVGLRVALLLRRAFLWLVLIGLVAATVLLGLIALFSLFYDPRALGWFVPLGVLGVDFAVGVGLYRAHMSPTVCYHGAMLETEPVTTAYEIQQTVRALLLDHPAWVRHLEEMVAYEGAHPPIIDASSGMTWGGWTWQEVHTAPGILNTLVAAGLVNVLYQSRSTTRYELRCASPTREALAMLSSLPAGPDPPASARADLFRLVVGHERAKTLLLYALGADQPVHVLLTGPPGTAKTLLISDIAGLAGAEFYAGSTTTKAGLVGLLLQGRPQYLVLDEIDKMAAEDLTPLLNLLEGGVVTRLQAKSRERITLPTRVFATANESERISKPILSRFLKIEIPAYTATEFVSVAQAVLVQREHVGPEMAKLIASEVVRFSLDIRDAVRAARMARGRPQDLPIIVRAMFPERRGAQLLSLPTKADAR